MTSESELKTPLRVSIFARLVSVFPGWIVMLGAALCGYLIMGVINAMRSAEAAGIGAVAMGMAEANLAVVVALYLAIFVCGIALIVMVVRSLTTTSTASPSVWFVLINAVLSVIPLALVWQANSLLIQALRSRVGVVEVVSQIQLCLTLTWVTFAVFSLVYLVISFLPAPSVFRARRSWSPIIALMLMEFLLIGLVVGFQLHMSWLQQVGMRESF